MTVYTVNMVVTHRNVRLDQYIIPLLILVPYPHSYSIPCPHSYTVPYPCSHSLYIVYKIKLVTELILNLN